MKVLLVNPPIREWALPNCFPSGLGYIATSLLNAGHEVETIDINAYRWSKEEVEEKIKNAQYDLVGTGGMVTIYRYIKWLVGILKKYHPEKRIMVGGSCATSIPHILLEKTKADIACIGEGEATVIELVRAIEKNYSLSDVEGIAYKEKTGEIKITPPRCLIKNLDALPFIDRNTFPIEIYMKNAVGSGNKNKWKDGVVKDAPLSISINSARGCPYKCIFCYHDFMGQRFRVRSAENIFAEICFLKEKYNITYFGLESDLFTYHKKNATRFCDLIIKNNMDVKFFVPARVDIMTEEFIVKLKEGGCDLIGYGIESGSQRMLDVMKKGVTVEQAKKAVLLTQKHLGWADCTFVIGFPGETRETIKETVDFCKELNLAPEAIFYATPYPGTELWDLAIKKNLIPDIEEYLLNLGEQGEKVRVNFTDFSDQELEDIRSSMVEELGAWNKYKHSGDKK